MRMIVEQQAETRIDSFASKNYYQPLGMATTGYLPRNKFELDRIIPTEYDLMFRKSQVHGDVHDPGAAMMGGIGGHAGLFANANVGTGKTVNITSSYSGADAGNYTVTNQSSTTADIAAKALTIITKINISNFFIVHLQNHLASPLLL